MTGRKRKEPEINSPRLLLKTYMRGAVFFPASCHHDKQTGAVFFFFDCLKEGGMVEPRVGRKTRCCIPI